LIHAKDQLTKRLSLAKRSEESRIAELEKSKKNEIQVLQEMVKSIKTQLK